jgi:hypothetical protein
MLAIKTIPLLLLLLAVPGWTAEDTACSKDSSVFGVRFSLALKEDRAIFREGETIPLLLEFTATTMNRYSADIRNYDRGGRLEIEFYCVTPEVPDPLASCFKFGSSIGGGLGNTRPVDAAPSSGLAWTLGQRQRIET